jgi:DNA processing protein
MARDIAIDACAGTRSPPGIDARWDRPDAPRTRGDELAQERRAWIVLATVDGVGERTLAHLVATHGSARRALRLAARGRLGRQLHAAGLERGHALRRATLAGIEEAARDPARCLVRLADLGVWALTLLDAGYPSRLLEIPDPPAVLFGQGTPDALRRLRSVAIVGTRRPTPAGRVAAARIARGLAAAGVTVVSGLAIGIDGAAHAAVVEGRGTTVAVIGAGHVHPGPRAHDRLVQGILASGGAVVSELPPDAHPSRGTYPRRNRIICGLADATLVVEAPVRSGALITARLTLEQGRPLFAVPGRANAPAGAGCAALLAESVARSCTDAAELLAALGICADEPADDAPGPARGRSATLDTGQIAAVAGSSPVARTTAPLGMIERMLATRLRLGPSTADELVALSGLAPGAVSGALMLLQLRGLARTLGPLYLPAGALLEQEPAG